MKSEIYNAIASMNRGFDAGLESLTLLREQEVLTAEYAQNQSVLIEELRSGINHMIHGRLEASETEDWARFGQLREATEARLKGEQPSSGPVIVPRPANTAE